MVERREIEAVELKRGPRLGSGAPKSAFRCQCRFHTARGVIHPRLSQRRINKLHGMSRSAIKCYQVQRPLGFVRETEQPVVLSRVWWWAQNWAQSIGVNPSVETVWNWHTCSSMIFPSQTSSSPSG